MCVSPQIRQDCCPFLLRCTGNYIPSDWRPNCVGNNLEADFTPYHYFSYCKKTTLFLLGPDHLFCESQISRAEKQVDEFQRQEGWLDKGWTLLVRTEKAAGLQEPGSLALPFWRREKIRGISVLSAWCYSYFGMHGSSVGSGPFSVHGAFCLSSVRSSDTLQQWQFTIATIAMDGCQTHPAPFTWCVH